MRAATLAKNSCASSSSSFFFVFNRVHEETFQPNQPWFQIPIENGILICDNV